MNGSDVEFSRLDKRFGLYNHLIQDWQTRSIPPNKYIDIKILFSWDQRQSITAPNTIETAIYIKWYHVDFFNKDICNKYYFCLGIMQMVVSNEY
jgi:hypothetical protein